MSSPLPSHQYPVTNRDRTTASVVIIGAGISGICTAIDLKRRNKCQNFIILEKGSGVGGTWRDNVYPGCGCDVWSHLYSFSFEQNPAWTREYSGQEEILAYLIGVAEKYGIYKHIRFNTSVEAAKWNDEEGRWETSVKVTGSKDAEYQESYTITSDFLVSAVGLLNYPSYPNIPGIKEFKKKIMHSARWDWGYKMENLKVAVIGNGATSVQIVPEVAKIASHVTVFQRSPNWVIPRSDSYITGLRKQALKFAPIRSRYRADLMDKRELLHSAIFDADSHMSGEVRKMTKILMETQIPNQPGMWAKLTPNFPPGCKRIIMSDDYYPALNGKNVTLETRPIQKFTSNGIEVAGEEHEFDLIILATGFRTLDYMYPIKVIGRNNRSIEDVWRSGPQAFKGVTVESLPNFGMLYGPNTSVTHNSIILMIEAQSRYISSLLTPVLEAHQNGKSLNITPRQQVVQDYNARIQKILEASSYAHPNCTSWFKNEEGKVITGWCSTVVDYQKELSEIDWNDFEICGTGAKEIRNGRAHVGRVVEETQVTYRALALSASAILCVAAGLFWHQTPSHWI